MLAIENPGIKHGLQNSKASRLESKLGWKMARSLLYALGKLGKYSEECRRDEVHGAAGVNPLISRANKLLL